MVLAALTSVKALAGDVTARHLKHSRKALNITLKTPPLQLSGSKTTGSILDDYLRVAGRRKMAFLPSACGWSHNSTFCSYVSLSGNSVSWRVPEVFGRFIFRHATIHTYAGGQIYDGHTLPVYGDHEHLTSNRETSFTAI